ncbi:MAG: 2-C-methyl-D-erythritol 2,4-cyclodiphosphate synthase [Bacteroidota bacterium]
MKVRTGFGYDVHRLEIGLPFRIGGVEIQSEKGAVGHSDADVLIHAICDALLGAAALRDIGYHFPDSSSEFKGIDSRILLKKTFELISAKGYKLGNLDSTVCLQEPKISSRIPEMITEISSILCTEEENVSVKATTTEKLGFIGKGEGISAFATVLIVQD